MKKSITSLGFSLVNAQRLNDLQQLLLHTATTMQACLNAHAATPYDFLKLPSQTSMHQEVLNLVAQKKKLRPALIVVVGIGGSNMGTWAIQEALLGTHQDYSETPIYYADSVDPNNMHQLCAIVEKKLVKKEAVLCILVSKSGTTTETIANGQIIIELFARHAPQEYKKWIVAITDKDSCLWKVAEQEGYDRLEIPKSVGGRFSVFSPVGLFPLAMLNLDIAELCTGAQTANDELLSGQKSDALLSAAFMYAHYADAHLPVHDTFVFALQLEKLGHWYRQLLGESLGKPQQETGISVGIIPTVSMGTIDLHSVGQTYLGGPNVVATSFVTVQTWPSDLIVPKTSPLMDCGPQLSEKSLSFILNAIVGGVQKAYEEHSLPFLTLQLPSLSPFWVGYFMQMKMIEVCYLGFLLNVNPFDQPQVEEYKKHTRRLLTHG